MQIVNLINQIKQDIIELETELKSHLDNADPELYSYGRLKETKDFTFKRNKLQYQIMEKKQDILELVLNCDFQ